MAPGVGYLIVVLFVQASHTPRTGHLFVTLLPCNFAGLIQCVQASRFTATIQIFGAKTF
jgi:hypothetical protein